MRAIFFCLITLSLAHAAPAQSSLDPSTSANDKSATSKTGDALTGVRVLAPGESINAPAGNSAAEPSLFLKGLSSLRSGEYAQAIELLRRAVEQQPNDAVAYAKLGVSYAAMHDYEKAVVALKMAIRIKPAVIDAEDYYELCNSYNALEKYSQALDAIKLANYVKRAEQADAVNANRPPAWAELHYSAGLALYNLRRYRDALKELQQVVAADPKQTLAHFGLAITHLATGDYGLAEKEQQILETLDPVYAARIAKMLAQRSQNPMGMVFVFKGGP